MDGQTYLFYDIETTGLNKCFDQILQFAAIRTDQDLNEVERHEMQVRLNTDVIPHPAAIITHRINLDTMRQGKQEIEAIREIHELVNTPNTISIGYNSLGFDDEFLRFSFYRNLLSPYTHQYDNQCSRADLYPMTALCYLFQNSVLNWPMQDGKISLKLENLSKANHLAEGQAHTAMVDVEACLALAKRFALQKEFWKYALGFFDRKIDLQRHQQLSTFSVDSSHAYPEAILIHGNFGFDNAFQIPALCLGAHRHYRNQLLWLALDSDTLSSTTSHSIPETTRAIRKKAGEPPFSMPFSRHQLSTDRIKKVEHNKKWIQSNPNLFQQIGDYHQHYTYPSVPNVDPNAALYEIGFPAPQETFLFKRFHLSEIDEKEKIALSLPNPIHREQAIRILGRHYPDSLSPMNKRLFEEYLNQLQKNSLIDFRGQPSLNANNALHEINRLETDINLDNEQRTLLADFKRYLTAIVYE